MLESVPWFIGGEAEHSPEVARMLAYAATSGSNGISASTHLHVTPTPVPGDHVRVAPGSAVLVNKYPGGENQSYMVRNVSSTDVYVPPTSSQAGSVRYLILRVRDSNIEGNPPADIVNGPYVEFALVTSTANLFFPHVVLAAITMPASTGTVVATHIADRRVLAQPRTLTTVLPRPTIGADTGNVLNVRTAPYYYPMGERFPDVGTNRLIAIPEWATRMQIRAEWLSVSYGAKAGFGDFWVAIGQDADSTNTAVKPKYCTQAFAWDANEAGQAYNTNWTLHDEILVRPEWRGTSQPFVMRANRIGPLPAYPGTISMKDKAGTVLTVRFMETPGAVDQ